MGGKFKDAGHLWIFMGMNQKHIIRKQCGPVPSAPEEFQTHFRWKDRFTHKMTSIYQKSQNSVKDYVPEVQTRR